MMKLRIVFLTCSLVIIISKNGNVSTNNINNLWDKIFLNYNPDIRPLKNQSKSVHVKLGIGLQEIIRLDEHLEKMTSSHWYIVTWRDEFLTWNKTEHGGINSITVPGGNIWVPDLVVTNGMHWQRALLLPNDYRLSVRHDGLVEWLIAGVSETHCRMSVGNFPFDTQVCSINLCQWSSYKSEITLFVDKDSFTLCFFSSSRSWKLNTLSTSRDSICGITRDFDDHQQVVRFEFTLTRRPLFHVISIILPVCFLSVLNPVVFLVSAESGEKMSLTISILISYFVVLSALTSTLPEVSDHVSILNVYVCTMLCLKVITVLSSAGIVSLYHRSDQTPIKGIYLYLLKMKNKKTVDQSPEKPKWKDVSKILDRIMFFIMSLLALVATSICFFFLLK